MKILSPGNYKKTQAWYVGIKVMCSHCKAVLEVEAEDSVVEIFDSLESANLIAGHIRCSFCEKPVRIEPGKSLP